MGFTLVVCVSRDGLESESDVFPPWLSAVRGQWTADAGETRLKAGDISQESPVVVQAIQKRLKAAQRK